MTMNLEAAQLLWRAHDELRSTNAQIEFLLRRALADAGADLVLCGHTHDGQLWPANWLMRLLWHNPGGVRRRGRAWLATTSGAGVWGPPMRVGTRSEVVEIHLTFSGSPSKEPNPSL